MTDQADFEARLAEFVKAIQVNIEKHYETNLKVLYDLKRYPTYELTRGPKFIRVVEAGAAQRSVYCFLDYQGNIYKADGWKKPAKHVRGSIFDENYSIGKGLTVYGGVYLR